MGEEVVEGFLHAFFGDGIRTAVVQQILHGASIVVERIQMTVPQQEAFKASVAANVELMNIAKTFL